LPILFCFTFVVLKILIKIAQHFPTLSNILSNFCQHLLPFV
jgi:hypothetical protein